MSQASACRVPSPTTLRAGHCCGGVPPLCSRGCPWAWLLSSLPDGRCLSIPSEHGTRGEVQWEKTAGGYCKESRLPEMGKERQAGQGRQLPAPGSELRSQGRAALQGGGFGAACLSSLQSPVSGGVSGCVPQPEPGVWRAARTPHA